MLYDELVPDGKYLAHYGVPKDQWSPEARARHNRNHPNKTIDPGSVARSARVVRNAYNEYQENNYNRGGNRSTFESKVDEQRAQLAEARHRNRSQHNSGDEGNKPNSGQHVSDYRKPRTSSYKTPGANAKPGRGRSSGKPSESSSSGYNPLRARFTRRPDPSINEVEAERRTNTSIRPNRSAGKKPNSGKRAGNGKNSASGYYNPDPHLQDRLSTPIRRTERSQDESVYLYERASGEAAGRFHNDVASRGGGYRLYTHHGQHVHQGPVGSGRSDVLFNKLKPAKDKSANSYHGKRAGNGKAYNPTEDYRSQARSKRPENRIDSGTRVNGGTHRTDSLVNRNNKAATEATNARKRAENDKYRSTRLGRNSKTWGSGKSSSTHKPGPEVPDHERYGWQNASSHRDAVEYDRRILQWNRGSTRAGVPGSGYGPLRPTIADDAQRTARRNRRNRN